eukprot:CAMPEP_0113492914 /NCGR_PEP_ID=MMETSP0014_2-20120614/28322_1 /TAXON_ID=2857 /ORGANISM="Nitzschia sp." /LENGTH=369 /DNA_ID=CAMNT_0000386761 /DNA_START=71 /DNA_END=1180 /DNA_ORIENTATION=+ /assembly_acc=CAM_ASM_000159
MTTTTNSNIARNARLINLCQKLQDIIGTDAGGRGMKSLIVQDDLFHASTIFGSLGFMDNSAQEFKPKTVVVMSGFPCCVTQTPPTETDGPPGTFALARCAAVMGHDVTVVTDQCNHDVFMAGLTNLAMPSGLSSSSSNGVKIGSIRLKSFPPDTQWTSDDEKQLGELRNTCDLLLACERAGPGQDDKCYTMRGINMNEKNLIAPLHKLVADGSGNRSYPFCAIGDGGNELGMGKVIQRILDNPQIQNGSKIGCVIPADHLVAASVSNWGGYALAVGAAAVHAQRRLKSQSKAVGDTSDSDDDYSSVTKMTKEWILRCIPTQEEEREFLQRCVDAGCRDGVSGKMEATVDGMPLETSLQCLQDLREAALS